MSQSLKEYAKFLDKPAFLLVKPKHERKDSPNTDLRVPVMIRDVRQTFGRLEFQIEPVGGTGTQWRERPQLELPGDKRIDR